MSRDRSPFPPPTLAIDFGTKRIGVAVSRGSLAEPLKILDNNPNVFAQLQAICSEEQIEQLLVGVSENEMAELTKSFVTTLQTQLQLPVLWMDETLSSHTVHQKVLSAGMKLSRRRQAIDHFAAAEFLQEWLDLQ